MDITQQYLPCYLTYCVDLCILFPAKAHSPFELKWAKPPFKITRIYHDKIQLSFFLSFFSLIIMCISVSRKAGGNRLKNK